MLQGWGRDGLACLSCLTSRCPAAALWAAPCARPSHPTSLPPGPRPFPLTPSHVYRRRLIDDVHCMMSQYLEETFFCFLTEGRAAEGRLAAEDAAAQVGGQRLSSELWWNLDDAQTPVALRLLPLLAEELAPNSIRWEGCGGGAGTLCWVD